MPRGDGTGPQGEGPGTGRGMGSCGAGKGKGRGRRNRFYAAGLTGWQRAALGWIMSPGVGASSRHGRGTFPRISACGGGPRTAKTSGNAGTRG